MRAARLRRESKFRHRGAVSMRSRSETGGSNRGGKLRLLRVRAGTLQFLRRAPSGQDRHLARLPDQSQESRGSGRGGTDLRRHAQDGSRDAAPVRGGGNRSGDRRATGGEAYARSAVLVAAAFLAGGHAGVQGPRVGELRTPSRTPRTDLRKGDGAKAQA